VRRPAVTWPLPLPSLDPRTVALIWNCPTRLRSSSHIPPVVPPFPKDRPSVKVKKVDFDRVLDKLIKSPPVQRNQPAK
jgi:hypothetical protein